MADFSKDLPFLSITGFFITSRLIGQIYSFGTSIGEQPSTGWENGGDDVVGAVVSVILFVSVFRMLSFALLLEKASWLL